MKIDLDGEKRVVMENTVSMRPRALELRQGWKKMSSWKIQTWHRRVSKKERR